MRFVSILIPIMPYSIKSMGVHRSKTIKIISGLINLHLKLCVGVAMRYEIIMKKSRSRVTFRDADFYFDFSSG